MYLSLPISPVHFSHSVLSDSLRPLCDPMNRSTPGLPIHHQLPEFTQTHAHQVSDAIQPSHPLSAPSPPAPNPSQHQGLFQRVNSLYEVAKVLESQPQHQSFQWTPRTFLLQDGLVGSPCYPRDSQESSPTPQFKIINFSALSFLRSPTLTSIHDHWKNHSLDQTDLWDTIYRHIAKWCCQSHWKHCITSYNHASLVAQTIKNLPAMWETWIWSLGQEHCVISYNHVLEEFWEPAWAH